MNIIFWLAVLYAVMSHFGHPEIFTRGVDLFIDNVTKVGSKININFGFITKPFKAVTDDIADKKDPFDRDQADTASGNAKKPVDDYKATPQQPSIATPAPQPRSRVEAAEYN